ncbi:MAG: hypothetical protein AAGI63_18780 [Planctomycetota bacterium]
MSRIDLQKSYGNTGQISPLNPQYSARGVPVNVGHTDRIERLKLDSPGTRSFPDSYLCGALDFDRARSELQVTGQIRSVLDIYGQPEG